MRAKSVGLLVLALGCGLVASLGITQVMARRNEPVATADSQSVFLAMKDVPQGDPLTAAALKLEQWPKEKVPPGALGRLEDVEGRRARTKLYAGELVLDSKLAPKGSSSAGYDTLIPKGYRVVAIRVDPSSSGGNLIMPGCRVDLLVHVQRNEAARIRETTTRTVLQDIKVFAADSVVTMDTAGSETKSIAARTVSLLVTPAQAEQVMLAQELGTIKLVIRSPEDEAQEVTKGAVSQDLFGGSEKGNREKEEQTEVADLNAMRRQAEAQGEGFEKFLQTVRNNAEAEQAADIAGPREDTWSMRVLTGADVQEVTMHSAGGAAGDMGMWQVSGLNHAAKADKPVPAPMPRAMPTPVQPGGGGPGNRPRPGAMPFPNGQPAGLSPATS
jgi:pilus assembly protein CpaB